MSDTWEQGTHLSVSQKSLKLLSRSSLLFSPLSPVPSLFSPPTSLPSLF